MQFNKSALINEIRFITSRSSGKGGQHVNKNETRVSLFFDVKNSGSLREDQKAIIYQSRKLKLSTKGIYQLDVEESRSQATNKRIAIKRLIEKIEDALFIPKNRKASKPSKSSIEKRLKTKKVQAEKKSNRKFKSDKL